VASAAQGVHSQRDCDKIAFEIPCDPLIERGLMSSGRPQSHKLCNAVHHEGASPWSSRQGCKSYEVKVLCRQLPGSDG
jgi:hypothetical protein